MEINSPILGKHYCKTEWNEGMTCKEYSNKFRVQDGKIVDFVKVSKERVEGCIHMTCKCGAEFCYLCGEIHNQGNEEHQISSVC